MRDAHPFFWRRRARNTSDSIHYVEILYDFVELKTAMHKAHTKRFKNSP